VSLNSHIGRDGRCARIGSSKSRSSTARRPGGVFVSVELDTRLVVGVGHCLEFVDARNVDVHIGDGRDG
jgi:hypothetical protein